MTSQEKYSCLASNRGGFVTEVTKTQLLLWSPQRIRDGWGRRGLDDTYRGGGEGDQGSVSDRGGRVLSERTDGPKSTS